MWLFFFFIRDFLTNSKPKDKKTPQLTTTNQLGLLENFINVSVRAVW